MFFKTAPKVVKKTQSDKFHILNTEYSNLPASNLEQTVICVTKNTDLVAKSRKFSLSLQS